jgi:hypothetical protein
MTYRFDYQKGTISNGYEDVYRVIDDSNDEVIARTYRLRVAEQLVELLNVERQELPQDMVERVAKSIAEVWGQAVDESHRIDAKAAIIAMGDAPVTTVLQEADHNQPSPTNSSGYSVPVDVYEYIRAMANNEQIPSGSLVRAKYLLETLQQREISVVDEKALLELTDRLYEIYCHQNCTYKKKQNEAIAAIRPYLRTMEPEKCPDCGADMIEVCGGLEELCKRQPEPVMSNPPPNLYGHLWLMRKAIEASDPKTELLFRVDEMIMLHQKHGG